MQDDGRLGDADLPGPLPDRHPLGLADPVANIGELAGQADDYVGQLALPALVEHDALAVGPHQEPMVGGMPAAVVSDRVGLTVDDVDRPEAEGPGAGGGHDIVEFIDMSRRQGGPADAGAEHAVGGAEAEFGRPQRSAVGGVDDQGGAES